MEPAVRFQPLNPISRFASDEFVRHASRVKRSFALCLGLAGALLATQRAPAAPATNKLAGFQVRKGFRLELVAAEPLVFDPVALAFDADGRLFVAEDRDYPGPDASMPHMGRVRLLEDTDGDGRFDTSKDFVEDLQAPSAVICWDHGVIVAAGAQILHCKDTDDDGRADLRQVLFDGATGTAAPPGTPLPIRSFVWGLDNRVHAAVSGFLSDSTAAEGGFQLNGHDFAFDPRTQAFEAESSVGSTGVSFDGRGHRFVCAPARPLRQVMWEARHAASASGFVLPPPLADISGPASATPLLALRAVVVPSAAVVRPVVVKRVTDYFSAASSLVVYQGNAFPPSFSEDVFVADARANVIHRFNLRTNGIPFGAERPADELGAEFLATTNSWFRPMQLAVGPDGALYIADLHREFVDPPARLPAAQRAAANLRLGSDQGRIYRIVPDDFKQPPAPRLAKARTLDLAMNLAHFNGWHRDTAARLLCEQASPATAPLLSNMLQLARSPLARLHALATLDGLGTLEEAHVARGLRDEDDRVCILAIRLAAKLGRGNAAAIDAWWPALDALADDASLQVRYELALACSELLHPQRAAALVAVLRRDPEHPWIRAAVLNALAVEPGDGLRLALDDALLRGSSDGQAFLRELTLLLGTRDVREEVSRTFVSVERVASAKLRLELLQNLDEGLRRAGTPLTSVAPTNELRPFLLEALAAAVSGSDEALRVAGIRLLAANPFAEVSETLFGLIAPAHTEMVQLAAIQSLARFNDTRVGTGLTQRWGDLPELARIGALDTLLARAEGCQALLAAIQDGSIRRDALSSPQVAFLRSHPDGTVSQRSTAVFGPSAAGDRANVVRRLQPALVMHGNPDRGRQVFLTRCAGCHRFRGEGSEFGPDLESAGSRGKEWVLAQFVDPNRLIAPGWANRVIETRHLGSVLGVIEHETQAGVVLRQPFSGRIALPRSAILNIASLNASAMPEGLETNLPPQTVADLLEFLSPTVK